MSHGWGSRLTFWSGVGLDTRCALLDQHGTASQASRQRAASQVSGPWAASQAGPQYAVGRAAEAPYASEPVARGRPAVFDHCDQEPGYRAGAKPARVRATASAAAVTPEPQ